jgi:hypothetical protein
LRTGKSRYSTVIQINPNAIDANFLKPNRCWHRSRGYQGKLQASEKISLAKAKHDSHQRKWRSKLQEYLKYRPRQKPGLNPRLHSTTLKALFQVTNSNLFYLDWAKQPLQGVKIG